MPQLVKLIFVNIVYFVTKKKSEIWYRYTPKKGHFFIMFILMYGVPLRMSHWEERGGLSPLLMTTQREFICIP